MLPALADAGPARRRCRGLAGSGRLVCWAGRCNCVLAGSFRVFNAGFSLATAAYTRTVGVTAARQRARARSSTAACSG